jgi:hypothetical protein
LTLHPLTHPLSPFSSQGVLIYFNFGKKKSPVFVVMLVVFMHDKFSLNKEIRITLFFALRDFRSTKSILCLKEKKNSPARNYFHVRRCERGA